MSDKKMYERALESVRLNRDGQLREFELTADGKPRLMMFRWRGEETAVMKEAVRQFKTTDIVITFNKIAEEVTEKQFFDSIYSW